MNADEMRASIAAERTQTLGDQITVDEDADTITLYGIRYSAGVVRWLALAPVGTLLRIEAREDGVLTVHEYKAGEVVTA